MLTCPTIHEKAKEQSSKGRTAPDGLGDRDTEALCDAPQGVSGHWGQQKAPGQALGIPLTTPSLSLHNSEAP